MIVCGQVDEGQHQSWNDWVFWFQNNQNITGMLPRNCLFFSLERKLVFKKPFQVVIRL